VSGKKKIYNNRTLKVRLFLQKISFASRNLENKALFLI